MQIASFLICIRNGLCQNGRFMILDKWHLAERMDHACVKTWRRTKGGGGGHRPWLANEAAPDTRLAFR